MVSPIYSGLQSVKEQQTASQKDKTVAKIRAFTRSNLREHPQLRDNPLKYRQPNNQNRHNDPISMLEGSMPRKKDHAVVAPDSRITKVKSSRSASNSVRTSNSSKNTARRPSSQFAPNKDTATAGPKASNTLDLPRKFIVGLDFGTTTTAVSYYSHPVEDLAPMALPGEVHSIMNWPGDDNNGLRKQVPTESWYSSIPRMRTPLQDRLGLDNIDSESSDSSSDEEDTISDASRPEAPCMPHPETLDRDSGTYRLGGCNCAKSTEYIWGYDVFNARYHEVTNRDAHTRIERCKSMLVRSEYTQGDRDVLRASLNHLLELEVIRKYGKRDFPIPRDIQDVISDFLTPVLAHTGQQLTQFAGLTEQCPVSFVITVPVIWSTHSSRVFQCAMEDAIRHSGFGDLRHGQIDNLYITTEPEAAATYLLATANNLLPGDTIIVLDCGGGTVDGSTHELDNSTPLRLRRQIGQPTGDNCGSSYLNDLYAERLLLRLHNEHYLDCNGQTRLSIVNNLIPVFERFHKRRKNIADRPTMRILIPGLKGDKERGLAGRAAKRFENNVLLFNCDDFEAVFFPILRRVACVLRPQLELAIRAGKEPKKIFLVGGFGACPSLISYLRSFLFNFSKEARLDYEITLVEPIDHHDSSTTVTCGSVLNHLDMNTSRGEERLAHSSFGFLRIEEYDPDEWRGHEAAEPFLDKFDGLWCVKVINYFMVKDTPILRKNTFEPCRSIHAFKVNAKSFLCEEVVYVSDSATESHYTVGHPKNRYAQVSGKMMIDMTHLKTEKGLRPIYPEADEDGVVRGKPHYKVEFDLFPIAEDRNLRYEARDIDTGAVLKTGQIGIAAAFKPGTH
ncbi:hypothetical protein LSUB1_G007092 [Lachnellula subtilissima]|uniref:Uncharacterized protein n=1 Tax=Lachnellula subtilissima TaxID=602034 RepID=A0A8H8RHY3_9HELO|nr:hypothetical protein LSUB1_G007092 [Lachnellula subtilissima]